MISDAQQHIQKFIDFAPRSRNAHLALLEATLIGLREGEYTEDDLVAACQKYFDTHKFGLYAFIDLRNNLETCDASVLQRVSQYCVERAEANQVSDDSLSSMAVS